MPHGPDNDHELLFQFFAGYFHEDYDLGGDSTEEIVLLYKRESSPESIARLRGLIRQMIESLSERELAVFLYKSIHCCYDPRGVGQTIRQWLGSIVEVLSTEDGSE